MSIRSTGVVRKVDELGRVVLPIELRRTIGIEEKDPLEIFVDGNKIVLQPYQPGCNFCGSMEDIVDHSGKKICLSCIKHLLKQAKLDQATSKKQVP